MVAINFTSENAPKVARWEKCRTIRKPRKRPVKVGDRLQLYTGQRTPRCRKLTQVDPICTEVWNVRLATQQEGALIWRELPSGQVSKFVFLGEAAQRFAEQDGFTSVQQMYAFFDRVHGLPFEGRLIKWEPPANLDSQPIAKS